MRGLRAGTWACAGLILLGLESAATRGGTLPDPRSMPVPPLHELKVPAPERYVLGNGMVVYLLADHDFPMVDARALVRAGSIYEPAEKVGLAKIAGEVMRTGGTTAIPGDALDEKLESMGATIEISIGTVQGNVRLSALAENAVEALDLMAGLMKSPALPDEKLDLAKRKEKTAIAGRNDDPLDVIFREVAGLVYGKDHPYARRTEYATVDAITRADLLGFHLGYFHPDRVILTVSGDFDPAKFRRAIDASFGSWARSTQPLPSDPPDPAPPAAGVYLIEKSDMTNSGVVIGQKGLRMDDPDYPAMNVWNELLGGGFSSRLFNEIRTRRGLAYASGSSLGAGYHHPGACVIYALTQADSTVATLGYVRAEVTKMLSVPVDAKELQSAKDRLLNSLVFETSSKAEVLGRLAEYEFYGYPKDFLQTYEAAVRSVTSEEVLAAAKRKIRYPEAATLIVGNREKFGAALGALGQIQQIDITIPDPAADAVPPATDADLSRGQELLAAGAAAIGGAALNTLKDVAMEADGTISAGGQEFGVHAKSVRAYPDCEREEQSLPFGVIQSAVCGEKGWSRSPRGLEDLAADRIADKRKEWRRDFIWIFSNAAALRAQALPGTTLVEGSPADVVYVASEETKGWKLYLDAASHLLVRMDYRDRNPITSEPGTIEEYYGDWRESNGVKWPWLRTTRLSGEPFARFTVTSLVVNAGVQSAYFDKPTQQ